MIKKSIILLFSVFFLLSNTGLPLTLHFCKMQKSEVKKCSSCSVHKENAGQVQIKKITGKCCQTEIIKSNIKDNYIGSKSASDLECCSSALICNGIIDFQNYIKSTQKNDIYPPLIPQGNLYLFNSILLI